MAISKQQKETILVELKDKIARQKAMVFATIAGVKVKDLYNLRKEMKGKGCELKVAKKTLISLALKSIGIEMDSKKIKGEVAVGFGYLDQVQPFKILYDFSKGNENLKIMDGLMDGAFLSQEKALVLAKLPTRDQLLSSLVGSLASPMSGMLNVLQGNLRGLVYILSQRSKANQS